MAFISDRRLYLTADRSAVVEEGDPAAAFLLVGQGGEISTAAARQYGLTDPAKRAPDDAPPEAKEPAAAEAERKAQRPAENKAIAPKADK